MFQPEGGVSCVCGKSGCDCQRGQCCKQGSTCCGDGQVCDKNNCCQGGPCGHDSKTGTV